MSQSRDREIAGSGARHMGTIQRSSLLFALLPFTLGGCVSRDMTELDASIGPLGSSGRSASTFHEFRTVANDGDGGFESDVIWRSGGGERRRASTVIRMIDRYQEQHGLAVADAHVALSRVEYVSDGVVIDTGANPEIIRAYPTTDVLVSLDPLVVVRIDASVQRTLASGFRIARTGDMEIPVFDGGVIGTSEWPTGDPMLWYRPRSGERPIAIDPNAVQAGRVALGDTGLMIERDASGRWRVRAAPAG